LSDPFRTILADPGWTFDNKLRMGDGVKRGAEDHYQMSMSVKDICALGKPQTYFAQHGKRDRLLDWTIAGQLTTDVGFLCLWAPAAFILDGSATKVARAWGYEPKQIVPWVKGRIALVPPRDGCHNLPDPQLILQVGQGRTFRNVVELLVICTRGEGYTKLVKNKGTSGLIVAEEDAVILAPRRKSITRGVEHSTKPLEQYSLIESTLPGPYLELFACEPREGWTSYGSMLGHLMTPDGIEPFAHPNPGLEWPA